MTNLTQPATRELAVEPGGEVEIVLPSGSVRVRGVDGDRVVVATRSGRPVDEALMIDQEPGRIRIRDIERGYRLGPLAFLGHRSEDVDVDLPRDVRLVVRTMSGGIEATGVRGESRWSTASGDVQLELDGGPVSVESMSGDVALVATSAVRVAARAVSGDLRIRAPRLDELDASSTSGDVRIEGELSGGGAHRLSSVSGDVELVTASPITLTTQTLTGDVRVEGKHRVEGGRGRRVVRVGDGSVPVTIRTTSGDIRLRSGGSPGGRADEPTTTATTTDVAATTTEAARAASTPEPLLVAEAEAAANLVRPGPPVSPGDDLESDARLALLRALERGDLDVETAMRRLEALEGSDHHG